MSTEHPILLNAAMVRAILSRAKTQTRLPIARLKGFGPITELRVSTTPGYDWAFRDKRQCWNEISHADLLAAGPFGGPGDRLWVRETFSEYDSDRLESATVAYRASYDHMQNGSATAQGATRTFRVPHHVAIKCAHKIGLHETYGEVWSPSIHMPRWASRITLEVLHVRVEHIQDITVQGALTEGMGSIALPLAMRSHRTHFASVWDARYAKEGLSWDENPWVFACEFKLIENQEAKS